MSTLGEILKSTRKTKGFSLEQVEKQTKIRKKFLEALEADQYEKLPSPIYIRGFVQNYSEFLRLDNHKMLALFRRQMDAQDQNKVLPKSLSQPIRNNWQMTPNKALGFIIGFLMVLFMAYFLNQYQKLYQAPQLTVEAPNEGVRIKGTTLSVFGTTDSDSTVVINTIPTTVKSDGKFFAEIEVTSGTASIVIVAKSRVGKTTTIERHITVE